MNRGFHRSRTPAAAAPRRSCFCPACGSVLAVDAKWCDGCGFTGAKTLEMFPTAAPPMMPLFDAAGLFDAATTRMIKAARARMVGKFPQFRINVWTVDLPAGQDLPVFGFWLLNACPLGGDETAEERRWTMLLLVNAGTGEAALVSGYAAESWLREPDLEWLLKRMAARRGAAGLHAAMSGFYQDCAGLIRLAWRTRVSKRRSGRAR